MKLLITTALVLIVAQVMLAQGDEFACQEGVSYIENECNTCSCFAPNGKMACTYKACFGPRTAQLRSCVVGTTTKSGCNQCWCVKDLGTICTNKKC